MTQTRRPSGTASPDCQSEFRPGVVVVLGVNVIIYGSPIRRVWAIVGGGI